MSEPPRWSTGSTGQARLEPSGVVIDAAGGTDGIVVRFGDRRLRIAPAGDDHLPRADEHYICRDEYHVNYPQRDADYGLRLAFDVVPDVIPGAVVMEIRLSVQTDLMDSHPTLDLAVDHPRAARPPRPADAISRFGVCDDAAIVLGPHDRPHTQNLGGRLRLFGDFLERGVIRRARPWIVWGREIHDPELRRTYRSLRDSPVPLTP